MIRSRLTRATAFLLIAAAAALCCDPLVASGTAAPSPAVRLSPASPLSSADFTARWRSPQARVKGRRYSVELRITAPVGSLCTTERALAVRRSWNRKDTLTFRLRANDRTLGGDSLWCPGRATLRVVSTKLGTPRRVHATLRFRVRADPANPVPTGTAVEADLLDGSQISVQVAGRPDRTTSLSGKLTGFQIGAGDAASEAAFRLTAGDLSADGLAIDPLCTSNGRTGTNRLALATSGSSGRLLPSGAFTLTLRVDEDPLVITGCEGPSGPAGRRTIALSGRGAADGGLSRVEAAATIDGVSYGDGATARIVLTLVLGFDLSPL